MAEVARGAGVGMATLYRNFPGRRELLEALYVDEVDAVCDAATVWGDGPPADAFVSWLQRFSAFVTSKHPVGVELLRDSGGSVPIMGEGRARVMAAARPLFAAAQEAEQIRGDLSLEQVLDLVVAIGSIRGEPGYLEPILRAALDGLRPSPR